MVFNAIFNNISVISWRYYVDRWGTMDIKEIIFVKRLHGTSIFENMKEK